MIKLLFGLILIFGLFLLLTGAMGMKILRALFGFGKSPQQPTQNDQNRNYTHTENRDKIFSKNEGEYVDFEEIEEKKDNENNTK